MIKLTVNGREHTVDAEPDTPLLYVLRDDLGLNGAKFGCGLGQCGACTVIVDGAAVFSCLMPITLLPGRQVTTIEGLGTADSPGLVQRAFIAEQAAQCGYCIAGMVMRTQALLARTPDPSEQQIRDGLNPNLCRCGTHTRILAAVRRAALSLREAAPAKAAEPAVKAALQ
jgi:nicotinate dehydrogenase subunit A